MKNINKYITEYIVKKKLDKPIDSEHNYKYFPETKQELIDNIKELFNKGETNLNCIDTSKITDMSNLFNEVKDIHKFNFDVSKWDVSNVENMIWLFFNCKKFDCDLSNWDVSNVEDMSTMFYNCESFKGKGLENWDVSKVENMSNMFHWCLKFDCDLSNWDTKNLRRTDKMFQGCKNMSCDLSNWNVNKLDKYSVRDMFKYCRRKFIPDWYRNIK